jgi:RING-type zinc-finger
MDSDIYNIECPICAEIYSDKFKPLVINCGHTVCKPCIITLVSKGYNKCPICNREYNTDINKLSVNYQIIQLTKQKTDKYGASKEIMQRSADISKDLEKIYGFNDKIQQNYEMISLNNQKSKNEICNLIDNMIYILNGAKVKVSKQIDEDDSSNLSAVIKIQDKLLEHQRLRETVLNKINISKQTFNDFDLDDLIAIKSVEKIPPMSVKLTKNFFLYDGLVNINDLVQSIIKNLSSSVEVISLGSEENKKSEDKDGQVNSFSFCESKVPAFSFDEKGFDDFSSMHSGRNYRQEPYRTEYMSPIDQMCDHNTPGPGQKQKFSIPPPKLNAPMPRIQEKIYPAPDSQISNFVPNSLPQSLNERPVPNPYDSKSDANSELNSPEVQPIASRNNRWGRGRRGPRRGGVSRNQSPSNEEGSRVSSDSFRSSRNASRRRSRKYFPGYNPNFSEKPAEWYIDVFGTLKELPKFVIAQITERKDEGIISIFKDNRITNIANLNKMEYYTLDDNQNVIDKKTHRLLYLELS